MSSYSRPTAALAALSLTGMLALNAPGASAQDLPQTTTFDRSIYDEASLLATWSYEENDLFSSHPVLDWHQSFAPNTRPDIRPDIRHDWQQLHTAALSGGPSLSTNSNPTDPLYAGQDDTRPKLYIGAHTGSLGFGLHAGLFANAQASARLSGDFLHLAVGLAGDDTDGLSSGGGSGTSGYTYNASAVIDNLSVALSANYHPGNGGFFVGGGAQVGAPHASFKANGTIWEGSNAVPYTLKAKVQPSWPIGPYASLGYSAQLQASPGLSFFGELGASYFGAVDTSQSANLNCSSFSTNEAQSDCQNIQSDFSNAVDNFSAQYVYPVLRLGFSYRF